MNTPKTPKYNCVCCKFITANKKDYKRHLLSAKHNKFTNVNESNEKNPNPFSEIKCNICNKNYTSRSGLWNHKKKCSQKPLENTLITVTDITNPAIIMHLIKESQ
uniref:C2H2-type domain-containing protein n=1 Tax=viral metagenome TaxID=1070528 RepID=A0A6C0DR53_9ZZZZ